MTRSALVVGILASLSFAVLLPAAAQAACAQWDVTGGGAWHAVQSSGDVPLFELHQNDIVVKGTAFYTRVTDESLGTIHYLNVTGEVIGTIQGNSLDVTVVWGDGGVAGYTAKVGSDGRLHGVAFNRRSPGDKVTWYSDESFQCVASAPDASGPVKKLGRVTGQPATPPLQVCEAARLARARHSPAAPGLEARCAALSQQVEAVPGTGQSADAHVLKGGGGGSGADLAVIAISGPNSLRAGLSGTYKIAIKNNGDTDAPVELHIIFAKALDQTGQIVAGAGLDCAIGHDAGINTGLTCTGGQLSAGETTTIVVQGRGMQAGGGVLLATLNPSHIVPETNYGNNVMQLNVNIN